jgi:hypothetical protein
MHAYFIGGWRDTITDNLHNFYSSSLSLSLSLAHNSIYGLLILFSILFFHLIRFWIPQFHFTSVKKVFLNKIKFLKKELLIIAKHKRTMAIFNCKLQVEKKLWSMEMMTNEANHRKCNSHKSYKKPFLSLRIWLKCHFVFFTLPDSIYRFILFFKEPKIFFFFRE